MFRHLAVAGLIFVASSAARAQGLSILHTVVNPSNGHTYHLLDNSDWTAAEASAAAMGAHLATVEDLAENSFLTAQFSNFGGVTRHLWIGYTDEATEGAWIWSSGSTSAFTNWWIAGGSPNNSTVNDPVDGEDYCCIYPTGEWEDLHNTSSSVFFPVLNGVVEVESLGTSYCTSAPTSVGQPSSIGASGSTSIAAGDLVLTANSVASGEPGIFYYGVNQISVPFGNGTRCVGGTVHRLMPPVFSAGGTMTRPVNYNALPAGGDIAAGTTWNFQAWFRDPAGGGTGFDLSDGLELDFLP